MDVNSFKHIPVLFNETIQSLNIDPDGTYVDCTAGGGGHSEAVAKLLTTGRLVAIDRDPEAIEVLNHRLGAYKCATIINDNFFFIKSLLQGLQISNADGIMADLGVNSHQLDDASRGFSFHTDAPLDMRMSMSGPSAADVVNSLPQEELQKIISEYGEEKFAYKISSAIVKSRSIKPIKTTLELSDIISQAVPAAVRREGHPARKTFQAIRIYVNNELDGLTQAVTDMFECLKPGGRLSIITFHSLEDKAVKNAFTPLAQGCTCPKNFPACVCGKKPVAKLFKPVTPGKEEIEKNPRSRSAKLRTLEKL